MSEEKPLEEEAVNEENVAFAEPVAMDEEVPAETVLVAEEPSQVDEPASSAPIPAPGAQKTDVLAIIAMVLGIVGLLFGLCCGFFAMPFSIGAIVCGFIAKSKISKNPNLKGRGMALTGILLGFASFVIIGLLMVFGVAGAIMDAVQQSK
jgi:uncharacterized membrane protein